MLVIIYIRTQFHDYIFEGLKNNIRIRTIEVKRRNLKLIIRIIRKILTIFDLSSRFPSLYFNKTFLVEIRKIEKGDNIFVLGTLNLSELKVMCNIFPNESKTHLWYWNPINKEFKNSDKKYLKEIIEKQSSMGFKIQTFDKEDSMFYNIGLRNQFYRIPSQQNNNHDIIYDFYFVGYAKDREDEIVWLLDRLNQFNYRVEYKIVKNKVEEIPYLEIIENILKSKCIIDVNQKGQSGLTLRPLEAMFFNKKLLTNNKDIFQSDFYHPSNIFILGIDNFEKISHFMNEDNVKLPDFIINRYEINNWMDVYL